MARPEAPEQRDDPWSDLRALLDQELSRLPDRFREPVVLCDLEGHTQKEAARRLGWPEGTVSGRLARARRLLAGRLARRGLSLSGGVLALALAEGAAASSVPAPLAGSTLKAATSVAAGHAAAGAISAPVAALTEGVLQSMCMSQVKRAFAVVLTVGLLGAGWGVYQSRAAEDPSKTIKGGPAVGAPGIGAPGKGAKINLPTTPIPVQVLASIDKDGKLVIKTATVTFRGMGGGPFPLPGGGAAPGALPPAAPAPGGGAGAGPAAPAIAPALPGAGAPGLVIAPAPPGPFPPVQVAWELRAEKYDLGDVQAFDTKGRKLDKKTVVKMLKKETVALASMWGQQVDPLHLRVLKDGLLVFVLPVPKGIPGVPGIIGPGQVVIPPAPALPPGAGGGGVGGIGIAQPGVVGPATVAPPVPPTGVKP